MPTRRVAPPADFAYHQPRQPSSEVAFEADVCCYLCGETCGVIESRTPPPFPLVVAYRRLGAARASSVRRSTLRCPRCGGGIYLDDSRTVRRWAEDINWALDAPRRGRPPKWLVELRARDAA